MKIVLSIVIPTRATAQIFYVCHPDRSEAERRDLHFPTAATMERDCWAPHPCHRFLVTGWVPASHDAGTDITATYSIYRYLVPMAPLATMAANPQDAPDVFRPGRAVMSKPTVSTVGNACKMIRVPEPVCRRRDARRTSPRAQYHSAESPHPARGVALSRTDEQNNGSTHTQLVYDPQ